VQFTEGGGLLAARGPACGSLRAATGATPANRSWTVRALRLRQRWLLVAVVLLDADDAARRDAVVGHAPGTHARPSRPRSRIGGELTASTHPRHDGVAAGEVVADLVRLPGQQLASRLESSAHCCGVALAPAWVDQVRPLGEADVRTD
jgi:hypothetical protein